MLALALFPFKHPTTTWGQTFKQALLLQHPVSLLRDTARYRPYMRPHGRGGGKLRPRRLKDLALEVLGMEIQEGKHDSVRCACVSLRFHSSDLES